VLYLYALNWYTNLVFNPLSANDVSDVALLLIKINKVSSKHVLLCELKESLREMNR
jgi:hypothetical protein